MYTLLGFLAVIFWSTTIALFRSLAERVGLVTAAGAMMLLSGLVGCAYLAVRGWTLGRIVRLPLAYLTGCGGLFVMCQLCLFLAIGSAANHRQVLIVGIINYLWPGLTLVFSLPVLRRKARPSLLPGAAMAFLGVVLAMAQPGSFSWADLVADLRVGWAPYLLALGAAVSWGLYSNFARKWAGQAESGAVPLFLLASGIVLAAIRPAFAEHSHWQLRAVLELLFLALVPSLLGYVFWDVAVRKGRMMLVVSASYVIPLLSTIISCAYLRVAPGVWLWVGCALVIGGAVICKFSVSGE